MCMWRSHFLFRTSTIFRLIYKAGIPEYYIETNISKRGKDWEIYNQALGSILKTDLPIIYKNTPLTAYDF